MTRALVIGFLWVFTAADMPPVANAETIPSSGSTDSRVRTAIYRSDEVYRLTGRVGYQIDIEFASDERYAGLASGDADALAFEAQANHLFIKPRATRVTTNMTILTDRRHYFIDYTVNTPPTTQAAAARNALAKVPAEPTDDGVIYALRFLYPEEEARQTTLAQAAQRERDRLRAALGAVPEPHNFNYWYCGATSIRPAEVSDNGTQTRFRFPARSELPAVFVRNDDATESLTNFTVEGDSLIVHRIARQFILRRGRLVGCVVNRSFEGSGDRPLAGATSPEVERLTPVVDP